jgi:sec-independent protein translocase protein TatC
MMARRGWVDYKKMAKNRKYVILVIFVVAAILTPPDVVSQCMLAAPMLILYEVAVQMTRFVKKKDTAE